MFVQNLAKNDLFDELKDIFWISKAFVSLEREEKIRSCFKKHVNLNTLIVLSISTWNLIFSEKKRR